MFHHFSCGLTVLYSNGSQTDSRKTLNLTKTKVQELCPKPTKNDDEQTNKGNQEKTKEGKKTSFNAQKKINSKPSQEKKDEKQKKKEANLEPVIKLSKHKENEIKRSLNEKDDTSEDDEEENEEGHGGLQREPVIKLSTQKENKKTLSLNEKDNTSEDEDDEEENEREESDGGIQWEYVMKRLSNTVQHFNKIKIINKKN